MASAPPAPAQTYTGQVESINIGYYGLKPGTCESTMLLAQAVGQEVTVRRSLPDGISTPIDFDVDNFRHMPPPYTLRP
jgi:hypothetical protein